jgi:hypothetical protein
MRWSERFKCQLPEDREIIMALEDSTPVERMELLRDLLARFCPRCGAHEKARVGPCGCIAAGIGARSPRTNGKAVAA